jgi:hypothetical protein
MVGDNTTNAMLQITKELCSDGVQKKFFLLFSSSCLMLHLAPQFSRVFKASSASSNQTSSLATTTRNKLEENKTRATTNLPRKKKES